MVLENLTLVKNKKFPDLKGFRVNRTKISQKRNHPILGLPHILLNFQGRGLTTP
jgi:hypothetical protein